MLGKEHEDHYYKCHNGHLFNKPRTQTVQDYDGFNEEIKVCPYCGCDESFYEKLTCGHYEV